MNHSLKMIAASLTLLSCASTALAQDNRDNLVTEVPLGLAIALQGDAALVEIRQSLTQDIPKSMGQMMDRALPQGLATGASPTHTAVVAFSSAGAAQ